MRAGTEGDCPPEAAVVLCVDERTAIQALDRTAPVLPLMPDTVTAGLVYSCYIDVIA